MKLLVFRGCSLFGTTSPSCPVHQAFKALGGLFPDNLSGFANYNGKCQRPSSGSLKAGVESVSNHYFPREQARRGVRTHRRDLQLLRRDLKGSSHVSDHKARCSRRL